MKSILVQKYQNFEYIIVDGASKDRTVDIIKNYVPLFKGRMRYISESDQGIYDAFTKGVNMASGTYVWIVNSDDYIEPGSLDYLNTLIGGFDKTNLPIISGAMNFVDKKGKLLFVSKSEESNLKRNFKRDGIGVTHPATLVPKVVYERYGAFDVRFRLSGDVDWFHRAYAAGCTFKFIDKVITNMSDGGISSQYTWKRYKISLRDRKLFFSKYYQSKTVRLIHFMFFQYQISKLLLKGYVKRLIK